MDTDWSSAKEKKMLKRSSQPASFALSIEATPMPRDDPAGRKRRSLMSSLRSSGMSKSLDTLPIDDVRAAAAAAAVVQGNLTASIESCNGNVGSRRSPKMTRREKKQGQPPVSPRGGYDVFKLFGRKRDKQQSSNKLLEPDGAAVSGTPPSSSSPLPSKGLSPRYHAFKAGSLDENEPRSAWGRGWGRNDRRNKDHNSGHSSEQPAVATTAAGNCTPFVIPHDMLQRKLDSLPADVYFKSLTDCGPSTSTTSSSASASSSSSSSNETLSHYFPCYMEGPDKDESERILNYSTDCHNDCCLHGSEAVEALSGGCADLCSENHSPPKVRACGQSISTYPRVLAVPGVRLGDPVCDCFALRLYQNGAIFCLCDGCGWGQAAVDAALSVRSVFMQSLHKHSLIVKQSTRLELKPTLASSSSPSTSSSSSTTQPGDSPPGFVPVPDTAQQLHDRRERSRSDGGAKSGKGKFMLRGAHRVMEMMGVGANTNGEGSKRSIRQAAECLLQLVAKAHNTIVAGKEVWACGTTTVCAGLVLELDSSRGAAQSGRMPVDEVPMSKKSALLFSTDRNKLGGGSGGATAGKDGRLRQISNEDLNRGRTAEPKKMGVLVVSIGDCKVYVYSQATNSIRDLTEGNRANVKSVNDCGGRLGPASGSESSDPDLRNLDVYYSECDEGDCVWAVSDGVHDNFDPQLLGFHPHDLDERETDEWEDIAMESASRLKTEFAIRALECELLSEPVPPPPRLNSLSTSPRRGLGPDPTGPDAEPSATQIFYEWMGKGAKKLASSGPPYASYTPSSVTTTTTAAVAPQSESRPVVATTTPSSGDSSQQLPAVPPELSRVALAGLSKRNNNNGGGTAERRKAIELTPASVTRKLIELCVDQTKHTREFMEQNPEKRQPCDYRYFPGKLDHTTCLAFRA